jgi:hypothetical protein
VRYDPSLGAKGLIDSFILPSGLLPSGFPTKTPYTPLLSPTRATCLTHLILLILSLEQYWVRSTDHEAPHYEVFSTSLLPRPS